MFYNQRTRSLRQIIISGCWICLAAWMMAGCMSSPYYQKTEALPRNEWHYKNQPTFTFEITDTASLYHLYFLIRHTDAYPYSNIWLQIATKQPGDTAFQQSRVEIPLAEKSGKWLGRGMGEIWEQRLPITKEDRPMIFTRPGKYEVRLEQNMRIDPLPEILHIGLRVAKLGHRKLPVNKT